MNYKVIDKETYYRKGVYRHFTEDCRCSNSLNIELPDGYLYFPPIVNWGRYREENGRAMNSNFSKRVIAKQPQK